jgi:hypothetical protein
MKRWVVAEVLSFVGRGEFLFVAMVCREWRSIYTSRVDEFKGTWPPLAISSLPRFKLALYAGGLDLNMNCQSELISPQPLGWWMGRFSSIDVIRLAREKGLIFGPHMCEGAAFAGRLSLLQDLHINHECSLGHQIVEFSMYAPSVEVLDWLLKEKREDAFASLKWRDIRRMLAGAVRQKCTWSIAWLTGTSEESWWEDFPSLRHQEQELKLPGARADNLLLL